GHDFAPLLRYISIRIRPNGRILAQRGAGSKCFSSGKRKNRGKNMKAGKKDEFPKGKVPPSIPLFSLYCRRSLFLFSNERYTVNACMARSPKDGLKGVRLFFCGHVVVYIFNRFYCIFSVILQGGASV
ncbi:MAG TPA: hypothetical protein P5219_08490, partial [Aminivibrio sp.]|nr:hypothetical protein [Aminivibrio sp.]